MIYWFFIYLLDHPVQYRRQYTLRSLGAPSRYNSTLCTALCSFSVGTPYACLSSPGFSSLKNLYIIYIIVYPYSAVCHRRISKQQSIGVRCINSFFDGLAGCKIDFWITVLLCGRRLHFYINRCLLFHLFVLLFFLSCCTIIQWWTNYVR